MERSFKIDKLPLKIQGYIGRLESNVEYLQKQMKEMLGESETNVFIVSYPNHKPLPENSRIMFIKDGKEYTVYFDNDYLCVHKMSSSFSDRLAVYPEVSNSIKIK